jgi:cation:H+ antiporter
MIGVSVLFLLLAINGAIGRWDSLLLLALLAGYLVLTWLLSRGNGGAIAPDVTGDKTPIPDGWRGSYLFNGVLFVLGLGLLALGSHGVIEGASRIAMRLGVDEMVIGLTAVAIGTSLPEIATSLTAVRRNQPDIAVGNVVGSNIFNLLSVAPVMVLVSGKSVTIPRSSLGVDLPVMLVAAIATLPLLLTQYRLSRWEGGLLLIGYAAYVAFIFFQAAG